MSTRDMELKLHTFLTSSLDGNERLIHDSTERKVDM
jgi:hypothetical protein